jgi:hypothetical protein
MTNWGNEDTSDLGTDNEMSGPKALRDAYEAMKKQNQDLQNSLQAIQTDLKQQKVASTLNELGVPAEAASVYSGDSDPEKVKEWAQSMKTYFGGGATSTPVIDNLPNQTLPTDVATQYQNITEAGQQGQPLGNGEAAFGRINDANSIQGLE